MADDLRLRVNGADYGGWTSARVTRGIEALAGSFDVGVSDRWAGRAVAWPILEEDEVELLIDGETLITGYVDRPGRSIGAAEHGLTVGGRDRAGALVDCSAILDRWEFARIPLLAFAQKVAEPFGVSVSLQPGLAPPAPLPKVTIDPGDSAFDALERACRMAAVLPVSDGRGGIVLTRAGSARATTAIVEGENLLAGSRDADASGRFRRYVVVGQQQGTDEVSGASAAAVRGEATDLGVRRAERVLVVRAEGSVTPDYAKRRAEWEAKVRAGRADSVSVTVQGWRQGNGELWPVNALVPVRASYLGIDGEMLITQATYQIDSASGRTTQLELRGPDAYLPEPAIPSDREKPKAKRWKELDSVPR